MISRNRYRHSPWALLTTTLMFLTVACSEATAPETSAWTLTVEVAGSGSGTIVSAPAGIQCASDGGSCSSTFQEGTVVTLTASPETTSRFAGWFSGCTGDGACEVTMTADRSVEGRFNDLPAPTLEHGVVEGFVFLDGSAPGGLRILRSAADAMGLDPAGGATVTLTETSQTSTSYSDGYFRLGGLSPGLVNLSIAMGSSGAQVPVTVYPDALLNLGEPPVARAEAMELALTAVPELGENPAVWLLAPQHPLPAGVSIGEALQGDGGRPEEALQAESWLFYLDDNPRARFQKDVRYLLVGAADGQVTIRTAMSWPTLNGRQFYADAEANASSPDLIFDPGPVAPVGMATSLASAAPILTEGGTGQTFGIVVQGANDAGFPVDADNVHDLITQQLNGMAHEYRPPPPGQEGSPISAIRDSFRDICQKAGPDDTVIISLHGHGTRMGSVEIQTETNADGTRASYVPWHPEILPWNECGAGRIIIMADLCFSAKLQERMQTFVERFPQHFGGREVIVLASAAEDEVAGAAGRGDMALGLPRGGFFTSALLARLGSTMELTTETLVQAATMAGQDVAEFTAEDGLAPYASAADRLGQNAPPPWQRPLAPGETLHPDGTVTQWGVGLVIPGEGSVNVPLSQIQGYQIAGPHVPVTTERGCEHIHIHSNHSLGPYVIVVTRPGVGAFPLVDPLPSHCGFGPRIDIPFP
ncbi:MAG: hypothetical protein WEA09_08540 [Gemmatimonadota bacterium]